MSDFKKQYDKELKYQEEKSNKYTLKWCCYVNSLRACSMGIERNRNI